MECLSLAVNFNNWQNGCACSSGLRMTKMGNAEEWHRCDWSWEPHSRECNVMLLMWNRKAMQWNEVDERPLDVHMLWCKVMLRYLLANIIANWVSLGWKLVKMMENENPTKWCVKKTARRRNKMANQAPTEWNTTLRMHPCSKAYRNWNMLCWWRLHYMHPSHEEEAMLAKCR